MNFTKWKIERNWSCKRFSDKIFYLFFMFCSESETGKDNTEFDIYSQISPEINFDIQGVSHTAISDLFYKHSEMLQ